MAEPGPSSLVVRSWSHQRAARKGLQEWHFLQLLPPTGTMTTSVSVADVSPFEAFEEKTLNSSLSDPTKTATGRGKKCFSLVSGLFSLLSSRLSLSLCVSLSPFSSLPSPSPSPAPFPFPFTNAHMRFGAIAPQSSSAQEVLRERVAACKQELAGSRRLRRSWRPPALELSF